MRKAYYYAKHKLFNWIFQTTHSLGHWLMYSCEWAEDIRCDAYNEYYKLTHPQE